MRIAVVTAHYLPEMGYVEVQLSRALAAEGHEVKVITSTHIPPRGRDKGLPSYRPGASSDGKVELERLSYRASLNQVVIPKGLRKTVANYGPDLVLAIGIGKLFPGPVLFPPTKRKSRLVGLFGNNRFNYRDQKLVAFQKRMVQKLFKDPQYDKAVRNCDQLWCYTPETEQLLSEFTHGKREEELRVKIRNSSLGFDAERFYFDEEERAKKREQWKLREDATVFLTATRLVPSKKLEALIEAFDMVMKQNPNLHYVLIGSSTDPYSQYLKQLAERSEASARFRILPFQREEELRACFNAADIGIWTAASITIQQGMGSGLPMILPESPALSHLLKDPKSGLYYRPEALGKAMEKALERFRGGGSEQRIERMMENRDRFSDRTIARDIVERSSGSC